MAGVELRGLTRRFVTRTAAAVDAIDLDIEAGRFVALLGPSGCGKTTLLRLVAGFERPDAGSVRIGQRLVADADTFVPPERRQIGMVFQSYALWPHMNVRENVGYPLKVQDIRGGEYERRVAQALASVGLTGLERRRPAELSGGQRQRVALARCLVMSPSVVLLDEPLANLDVHLRASLQAEFKAFHRATGATMLYVTHDQGEALALADRIAVMDAGRVLQYAAPEIVYREPAAEMVARFVGRGAVVRGTVLRPPQDGHAPVRLLGVERLLRAAPRQAVGDVMVCLRPEDLMLVKSGVTAHVLDRAFLGAQQSVRVQIAGEDLYMNLPPALVLPADGVIALDIGDGWVIPGP